MLPEIAKVNIVLDYLNLGERNGRGLQHVLVR
jgi:hypothetical protein